MTIESGYVVATAYRAITADVPPVWELRAAHAGDSRPSARTMGQYRQAFRGQRVRPFTDADWVALPYGQQDSDRVWLGDRFVPRDADGIR